MNNDISSFPGAVMAILILAFVLTIPIGIFIISRYKKALIRGKSYSSLRIGPQTYNPQNQNSTAPPSVGLKIYDLASSPFPTSKSFKRINALLQKHWFIYGAIPDKRSRFCRNFR